MNNLLGQFEYRGTHADYWEIECKKAREEKRLVFELCQHALNVSEQELSRQKEINVKLAEATKQALEWLEWYDDDGAHIPAQAIREALSSARPQSMDNGQENLRDSEKSSEKGEV